MNKTMDNNVNELLKVNYRNEQPMISGRDLHDFLGIETPYKNGLITWLNTVLKKGETTQRLWTKLSKTLRAADRPPTTSSLSLWLKNSV